MQVANTVDSESLNQAFGKLNLALEADLKTSNPCESINTREPSKIVNSLGESLLQLYLGLNLDLEKEIVPLWKQYYFEIFGTCLKVCKNPLDLTENHDHEQPTVMSAINSAASYFADIEAQAKDSSENIKSEAVALFYDMLKYFTKYKDQCNDPGFYETVKAFLKEATKWLISFTKGELQVHPLPLVNSEQANSEQNSEASSQVLRDILDISCDKAFELIQKQEVNDSREISKETSPELHYRLAELLWHFSMVYHRQINSEGSLRKKLISKPIQEKLAQVNIKNRDPTFEDLARCLDESTRDALFNSFNITAFDTSKGQVEVFSAETTPDAVVSDAVLASLSALNFRKPLVIRKKQPSPQLELAPQRSFLMESIQENIVVDRAFAPAPSSAEPYRFMSIVYSGAEAGSYQVFLNMDERNKEYYDYFAVKSNGQPTSYNDYDDWEWAGNWAYFSESFNLTDQTYLFYGRNDATNKYAIYGQPQQAMNKSKWMERIFDSISSKTLAQIMIPGAHNAGTYNTVTFFLQTWVACQQSDFTNQLNGGIRYFDCRVAYYPDDDGDHFWFAHDTYNTKVKLQDLLGSVSNFLQQNSKEIVILDFNHFRDSTSQSMKEFIGRLDQLGPYIADSTFQSQPIGNLVMNNKRLIILSDTTLDRNYSGSSINSMGWANTDDVEALKKFLETEIQSKKDYKEMAGQGLNLIQTQLTPAGFPSILVDELMPMAYKASEKVRDALMQDNWLNKVNVLFSDYACNNSFADIAIYANSTIRR